MWRSTTLKFGREGAKTMMAGVSREREDTIPAVKIEPGKNNRVINDIRKDVYTNSSDIKELSKIAGDEMKR